MLTVQAPLAIDSSKWMMALIKSVSATALCVVMVGVPFLPKEISRLRSKQANRAVYCAAAPDGKSIVSLVSASASEPWNHRILLHDLSHDPPVVRSLLANRNPICAVADPINHLLFAGDVSGALLSINLQYSDHYQVLGHGLRGLPESISCSQDGKTVVVGDSFAVYSWDVEAQWTLGAIPRWCRVDPSISCFAITPDSLAVICAKTSDHRSDLLEVDIRTGETRGVLARVDQQISKLAMSADGKYLAGVGETGKVVLLQWHFTRQTWQPRTVSGLCSGTTLIACFSRDGELLITSDGANSKLIAWDLVRGEIRCTFDQQGSVLLGCDFSDDERLLSWSMDGKLQIWDLQSSAPIREIQL